MPRWHVWLRTTTTGAAGSGSSPAPSAQPRLQSTAVLNRTRAASLVSPDGARLGGLRRSGGRGEPVERLRREPVERLDAELEVLGLRVLELRVREAAEGLDE